MTRLSQTPFSLRNRHGLQLFGSLKTPPNPKGLAFVQHGLSGSSKEPHIQAIAALCGMAGYQTIMFDASHSFGPSAGDLFLLRPSTHAQDLEDVISWAQTQPFYQEPFLLAGHSLGGFSILSYACHNASKCEALALFAPVVCGPSVVAQYEKNDPAAWDIWKSKGYQEKACSWAPARNAKLSFAYCEELRQHDLLPATKALSCPCCIVTGARDERIPHADLEKLAKEWRGPCAFHTIPELPHTPRTEADVAAYVAPFKAWLNAHAV